MDNATCGFSPATPCASIPYAVNGIGPYVLPATSMLTVIVGPGLYGATSCGAYGLRPLNITGAGSGATIIDCAGTNRMLFAFSVTFVSGLTVRRGLAVVTGSGANGVAVDGGGAIAILWSAANTPPGGTVGGRSCYYFLKVCPARWMRGSVLCVRYIPLSLQ